MDLPSEMVLTNRSPPARLHIDMKIRPMIVTIGRINCLMSIQLLLEVLIFNNQN